MVNLKIFKCFPGWAQISPKELVSEQITSMWFGKTM